ncbi:Protein TIFY 11B -like protein [Gossypium arboreum]|uniref:Protein TIFY n=1 Tax=Gossypium arboreum TaxID=29729 RepID=A0A0B0NX70_GOSAR|nr:Protein TIFY 11B -like protein [Gossypium arboreum]
MSNQAKNPGRLSGEQVLSIFSVRIETSRQQTMTKNFLPNMDNSYESLKPNLGASTSKSNAKRCGFFPEIRSFGVSSSKEDTNRMTDFRKPAKVEPKNSQMTIFFGSQVAVFNDFPADKFKEIMDLLASHGCSTASGGVVDTVMEKVKSKIVQIEPSNHEIPDLNVATATGNSPPPPHDSSVEWHQYGGSGSSDLRIARRNSLHKFFEKRKERATARAPYQVNNARGSTPPPKPNENKSSHEEGQSSKEALRDLDLKL